MSSEVLKSEEIQRSGLGDAQVRLQAEIACHRKIQQMDELNYLLLDASGYLIEVNQVFENNLGYGQREILGKNFAEFLLPQWRHHFLENLSRFHQNKEIQGLRVYLEKSDGSSMPISLYGKSDQQGDGKIIYHCFFESNRKLSFLDGDLQQKGGKQADLSIDSQEMSYRLSLSDGLYEYVSQSAQFILGYPPSAFYESPLLLQDIVHPDSQAYWQEEWEKFLTLTSPITFEYQIIKKDGSSSWVRQRNIFIRGTNGTPLAVEGIIADISERVKLEVKLRQAQHRYKTTQQIGRIGSWEYNLQTKRFWCSEEAKKINGFPTSIPELSIEVFEDTSLESQVMKIARENLLRKRIPYDIEFETRPEKGQQRGKTLRSVAEVLKDDSGDPVKIVGVIQDITKEKKIEREKNNLKNQLKQSQKLEAIGSLAGGIAHDFNNILSAVLGFTDLSLRNVESGSELEEDLQQIYTAGLRAKDLVKQILTFARKSDEELKPVRVDLITKEVIKFLRSTIPTTIEISAKVTSSELILANPVKIHQLIMNLCANAAHAMNDLGKLSISLEDVILKESDLPRYKNMQAGLYQRLQVEDTGCGIGEEIIDSIFEPFFTTKNVHDGTGMGLALVNTIVKECGGDIWVKSEVGKGSCFTILLPAANETELSIATTPVQKEAGGDEKILVVDDEKPICRVLYKILGNVGYKVTTMLESEQALKIIAEKPRYFDLVITDMAMPNKPGDILTREILAIRPDLPVIIATGYSRRMTDPKAEQLGAKAFLAKPFEKTKLIATVRRVLDESNTKKSDTI